MPDQFPFVPTLRHAEVRVLEALQDTRIVALVGPRQSGKTTLARKVALERGMNFVTLDDEQFLRFAQDDPSAFLRGLGRVVIDEVQRAPALILALKKTVDEEPRAGRFLITGSVDLLKGALSPDSLAGRVETMELLPFSQAEMHGCSPSNFLSKVFACDFPALEAVEPTPDLAERVVAGGYPEALARVNPARRRAWLTAYARALTTRDAAEISPILKVEALSRLLNHAAVAAGQLVNISALATPLGVDSKTVDRWLTLLEQMFVVRRVSAWHRNDLKRLVRAPKIHFLDTGLLSALRRVDADDIRARREILGPLLEGFVFTELAKQVNLTSGEVLISHYRDKDQVEVDFVLEQVGQIVGIEVKAAATVRPEDFHGLKRLQEAAGDTFRCGVVLHDGQRIQRVGERLYAMPVSRLWR
jgi:uncharacterized protein